MTSRHTENRGLNLVMSKLMLFRKRRSLQVVLRLMCQCPLRGSHWLA